MNRRGIMVDPPPHSSGWLKTQQIHPRLLSCIILTHCHADHDAGTFQKVCVCLRVSPPFRSDSELFACRVVAQQILEEGRVVLITTELILGSFLRKYSAISGLSTDFLKKLFVFRPVTVGAPLPVFGMLLPVTFGPFVLSSVCCM
jgi:hypothetical protein